MDLFVSYAWASDAHRSWVRLLTSQLHLLGYDVRVDTAVDYGSSLSGFMREVTTARHVLLVVDTNYVHRADSMPESGVGIETAWLRNAFPERPPGWLSIVFVDNPSFQTPDWLLTLAPKGFDFNSTPSAEDFPGSGQISALWRWLEDLPPDPGDALSLKNVRERAARLERIARLRDPGSWRTPSPEGMVTFRYREQPESTYTVGFGDHSFPVEVSEHGFNSITIYQDKLSAIGLLIGGSRLVDPAAALGAGRTVHPRAGQGAVLMNTSGNLCTIRILDVQREVNERDDYVAPSVTFEYTIHQDR